MTTIGEPNEEPTAHYFHASLYKFSMAARATVIDTFHAKIGNIAARCSYDEKKDLFSLDCPTSQGAFCDEQLYNFVTKYVEEELSSAEREQRRPQVQQFSESKWEWEHDREEGSDYAVEESVPRASIIPAVAAHTVIAPDECKHLKFFQMAQLPDKFLQRVLCARTTTTLDTLLKGLTCRAVLWKLGEGFVFNGRDGAASLHGSSGSYRQIDYSEFPVMSDSRDQAILDALDRTVASKTPASRKDAGPVDSWIETVEETTQVPPDEAADLPKATKKMLAEDEMRSSGRPRVPLGYLPGMAEPDLSSDDDEKPSAPAIRPNFEATMLLGNPGTATYPCEFSDSDESSDSDHTTKAVAGTTHKLSSASSMPQPENSKPPKRTEEWSKVSISLQTPPRRDALLSQTQATPTVISSTTPHSATSQSANHDPLDFVEYDKKYARVDNFGLTGNAGLTASHAQENHIATPVRPKRHAIRPRERKPNGLAKTDFEGTQPSARSVTGSGLGPVASTPASATRGNTQALAPAQWEQNITSRNLATGDLVDVASTPLSRPMRMPPGFSNPSQSNVQRSIPSVQDIGSDSLVDVAVVDVMEQSPSRPSASNRLPTDQLLHPAPTDRMHAANEDVAEDTLADFAPSFSRKRNTMNQRAGKNAKSRGKKQTKSSGKKIIAELPMPDPLPPPRARNVNIPGPSTPKAGTAVPIDEQPPLNKFQQALLDTIEKQYVSDDEDDGSLPARNSHRLVLDICQLLLLPEEPDLEKQRASTAEVIQDLLASSEIVTKCFPRLSSSAPDGNILVDLIGSSTTPRLVYEVLITDTAGQKLLCAIPSDDKANFTVKSRHEPTAYEYLHHPVHVWDARLSLMPSSADSESHSLEAIEQFVSSMATVEDLPSFCAYVAGGQFEVQAVYALRTFEAVRDGITSRVTEKQVLHEGKYRGDGRHNYSYTASSSEAMMFDQRMWWEVMLETEDLAKREEMLRIATFMVENMDGVGMDNVGAWMASGEDVEEEIKAPKVLYDELGRKHLEKMKLRY